MATEVPLSALEAFCLLLKRSQRDSAVQQKTLARRLNKSEAAVSAILNGKIHDLPSWDDVEKIVITCQWRRNETELTVEQRARLLAPWRRRYSDLQEATQARKAATKMVSARKKGRQAPAQIVGERPVSDWHPFDLGVHRAIETDHKLPAEISDLPLYVERAHDARLLELLSGVSGPLMVVLVGGSSTGKTRACYEAIQRQMPEWPLNYPNSPAELTCYLSSRRPNLPAVVWVDETQWYFQGSDGPAAVAALRRALTEDSGPMVIIGSMWRSYWREFTDKTPEKGSHSLDHVQTRALLSLTRVHKIDVPEEFVGVNADFEGLAAQDPRLALALRAILPARRKITQVLAGGVALLDRYEHPLDIYSQTLITVAMDVCRLGYRSPLTPELLEQATSGYLDPQQRAVDSNWFVAALNKAAEEVYGIRALEPIRTQDGLGPSDSYILHDYLNQHGRSARSGCIVPDTVWDALSRLATNHDDRVRLAEQAIRRGLFRYAFNLVRPAATSGDFDAIDLADELLAKVDRKEDALTWLLPLAELGNMPAMNRAVHLLETSGQEERALDWLQSLVIAGNFKAVPPAWELFKDEHARVAWLKTLPQDIALQGLEYGAEQSAKEAQAWKEAAEDLETAKDKPYVPGEEYNWLIDWVWPKGDPGLVSTVEGGPRVVVHGLQTWDKDETVDRDKLLNRKRKIQHRAEAGDADAMVELASILERLDLLEEATAWYRTLTQLGLSYGLYQTVFLLQRLGRTNEARQLEQFGIEPGGRTADAW